MNKRYNETKSSFLFKFDGDNEIDAKYLSKSIDLLANTFSLITDGYNPDSYMKMKVSALSPGSFVIDFDLLVGTTITFITGIGTNNAQAIVSIFIEILKTKLFLKGNMPSSCKEGKNNVILENCEGTSLTINKNTYNIYKDSPKIDENIASVCGIAQEENRSGLEIKSNIGEVSCHYEDFEKLKKFIFKEPLPEKFMHNTVTIDLLLRSPDLIGHSKWGFYFNKTITATIEDETFINKVLTGQIIKLYAGVKIPVEMEIITPLDLNGMPIENKEKYVIKKITGDIIEPNSEETNQISFLE